MDAIELLTHEHRYVEDLFKKLETGNLKVVPEICKQLTIHALIEEQIFYPVVRNRVQDTQSEIAESFEEHHVMKVLIDELGHLSADDESYQAKATVLMENVRHHVNEEETELFPQVQQALAEDQLDDLGEAMRDLRMKLERKVIEHDIDLRETPADLPEAHADSQTTPPEANRRFEMTTTREVMTAGAECIGERQTLREAATKMRDLEVGALPICGEDGQLHGMITDRDIVIKCLAEGMNPDTCTASEFAQGKPFFVNAEDSLTEAVQIMEEHRIRRLPVVEDHRLVGIVSQGDLAKVLPPESVGDLVSAVSS